MFKKLILTPYEGVDCIPARVFGIFPVIINTSTGEVLKDMNRFINKQTWLFKFLYSTFFIICMLAGKEALFPVQIDDDIWEDLPDLVQDNILYGANR